MAATVMSDSSGGAAAKVAAVVLPEMPHPAARIMTAVMSGTARNKLRVFICLLPSTGRIVAVSEHPVGGPRNNRPG
jgi:hypothetical protein